MQRSSKGSNFTGWVVAVAVLFAGASALAQTAKWSYGFIEGGNIVALAEESAAGVTVYAASSGGLFKSTNSGGNWSYLPNAPAQVTHLAWDGGASVLYAANSFSAWKSADHGSTWTQIYHSAMTPIAYATNSFTWLNLTGLIANSGNVYLSFNESIGGVGPLLMSTDAGKTWRSIIPLVTPPATGPNGGPNFKAYSIFDMKMDPYHTGVLYIVSCNRPFLWNNTNITSEVCLHPISDSQVYASYTGVTNGWIVLGTQALTSFSAVYPQRDAAGVLYGLGDGIMQYLCSKGNCDWSADTSQPPGQINNLLVDGCLNNQMMAGTQGQGVAVNAYDSSQNWTTAGLKAGLGNDFSALDVGPMALHCGGGAFAGLPGGVWLTENIGADWTAKNTGLEAANVSTLTIGPDVNRTVWAGTDAEGLWKSADGGVTWTAANNGLKAIDSENDIQPLAIKSIAIEPQNPQIMLVGTNAGLFRSADAGNTWTSIAAFDLSTFLSNVVAVAADPLTAGKMYAFADGGLVMETSTDSGKTWTKSSGPNDMLGGNSFALSAAVYPMYAATQGGIYVLASSTSAWKVAVQGYGLAVATDPHASKTVYASTLASVISGLGVTGLSKSIDGGLTWTTLSSAPAGFIYGLTVDSSSTIYAAARSASLVTTDGGKTYNPVSGGLWSSADGGKTWTSLGVLPGRDVLSVERDSATGTVYAGVAGLGVGVFAKAAPLPILSVTPASLSFTVKAGAANPSAQTVTIKNTGTGSMNWTASNKQGWLTLGTKSGTLAAGASATISVQPATAALAAGQFADTIAIAATGARNSPASVAVALAVQKAATTTTLKSSASPVAAGKPVTLTATPSTTGPKAPTGTVTFSDGATALGSIAVKSGAASLTTSKLAVGTHSIKASYSGDSYNSASASAALTQIVK
jgi:hypothetical protein